MQNSGKNEFLKHLKHYEYLSTTNHDKLLTFIESEEYEVFIMGHSCGLSDRSLLSIIFESKNCKSIRIFYHADNKDDFKNKTFEISRHFKSQNEMLSKVVKQTNSTSMPQAPKQP